MLRTSLQRFRHGVNRRYKALPAYIIGVPCLIVGGISYLVIGHLRGGQLPKREHGIVELHSNVFGNVGPDFRRLGAEFVNPVGKICGYILRSASFGPGSESTNEAIKVSPPLILGVLKIVHSIPMISDGGELMIGPPSNAAPQSSPSGSRKENHGGIELGHLLIWGGFLAVISFLVGAAANSLTGRLEKPYPTGGNTIAFYMTYIKSRFDALELGKQLLLESFAEKGRSNQMNPSHFIQFLTVLLFSFFAIAQNASGGPDVRPSPSLNAQSDIEGEVKSKLEGEFNDKKFDSGGNPRIIRVSLRVSAPEELQTKILTTVGQEFKKFDDVSIGLSDFDYEVSMVASVISGGSDKPVYLMSLVVAKSPAAVKADPKQFSSLMGHTLETGEQLEDLCKRAATETNAHVFEQERKARKMSSEVKATPSPRRLEGSPSGKIDTSFWIGREIPEFGLAFKLPKAYKEKRWEVVVGPIQGRRFYAGPAFVDFQIEEETTFDRAKTRRQLDYDDYREWTDEIRGHKVLIQTFRGGGSIYTEKGVFPPHQVAVVCELDTDSKRFLTIDASCATKEEQEEILAMVGTLEFSKTPTLRTWTK